jgi:hypothetical protein
MHFQYTHLHNPTGRVCPDECYDRETGACKPWYDPDAEPAATTATATTTAIATATAAVAGGPPPLAVCRVCALFEESACAGMEMLCLLCLALCLVHCLHRLDCAAVPETFADAYVHLLGLTHVVLGPLVLSSVFLLTRNVSYRLYTRIDDGTGQYAEWLDCLDMCAEKLLSVYERCTQTMVSHLIIAACMQPLRNMYHYTS